MIKHVARLNWLILYGRVNNLNKERDRNVVDLLLLLNFSILKTE